MHMWSMVRRPVLVSLVVLSMVLASGAVMAEPRTQSGEAIDCSDAVLFYRFSWLSSPLGARVDTQAGTEYTLTSPGGHLLVIDFYDADGSLVGYDPENSSVFEDPESDRGIGAVEGTVPDTAAYAIVCQRMFTDDLDYSYVYTDGL